MPSPRLKLTPDPIQFLTTPFPNPTIIPIGNPLPNPAGPPFRPALNHPKSRKGEEAAAMYHAPLHEVAVKLAVLDRNKLLTFAR